MMTSMLFPKGRVLHNCRQEKRCYITAFTADWGAAADWFPRGIMPSDADNCIESSGALLVIEWKPSQADVSKGQRMLLRKITEPLWVGSQSLDRRNYSLLCVGDPKTLECSYIELFKLGSTYECYPQASKELLKELITGWFEFVDKNIGPWPALCLSTHPKREA